MATHTQIPIKVNAWVDEGIAPLVEALNGFHGVWTLSSCEDDRSGRLTPYPAYVVFSHQGGRDVSSFGADLMAKLGTAVPCCLQTDWRAENGKPLLTISCPRDRLGDLAAAVRKAAEPADGSRDRGLRS
jgi:hypothetical protein